MSDHNSFSSGVLTASVMTHPLRATRAESLCSELGPEHAWAAVDPHPQGPPPALRSARVAFAQAAREKEGHHLVLQDRSEEHTSELQSRGHLVCRLLLEKKK